MHFDNLGEEIVRKGGILDSKDFDRCFSMIGRLPTVIEEHILKVMWSEHCSYKSTKSILSTLPVSGKNVVLGVGEDGGIIHFSNHEGVSYGIVLSHESHNHPSQILPVEGAATGVGGVVRDVYCMGAKVIGVLNSLHFGLDEISQRVAKGVVEGISDYANPLGVPVLGGEVLYHESYNKNCLVNVAAIGLLDESAIVRSAVPDDFHVSEYDYDIILLGKSTDGTGFGGAYFSSKALGSEDVLNDRGAVQVHDPFLKRVIANGLMKVFALAKDEGVSVGCKDLGAGGIACATSEIVAKSGLGATIDLDKVNVVSDEYPAEVILCSETQERFCLVVPSYFSDQVCKIFNETFDLPSLYPHAGAVVIGKVTKNPVYSVNHKGNLCCSLPIGLIVEDIFEPRVATPRLIEASGSLSFIKERDIYQICLDYLASKNLASKRHIYTHYDNAVQGKTIVYPGESDAVIVAPIEGAFVGLAVSIDSNLYGLASPYASGALAVSESIRNIIAVGAVPIALTDCLNYGVPSCEHVFWDFDQGVKGIGDAARMLNLSDNEPVPIISGNVSMSNSHGDSHVIPSPVLMCVGRIDDYRDVITMHLTEQDLSLILLGERYPEFKGTLFEPYCVHPGNAVGVRLDEEKKMNQFVHSLMSEDKIRHCHDVSMGGLWVTLCEMLFGEKGNFCIGLKLVIPSSVVIETMLFSESPGYVLAIKSENLEAVKKEAMFYDVPCYILGETSIDTELSLVHGESNYSFALDELLSAWRFFER